MSFVCTSEPLKVALCLNCAIQIHLPCLAPNTHTLNFPAPGECPSLPQWSVGLRLTKFDSRLSTFLEMAPKRQQESGAEKRKKKLRDDAHASLAGKSMFNHS